MSQSHRCMRRYGAPMPDAVLARKLLDVLGARLNTKVAYAEPPTPLAGGFSNEIFRFLLDEPPSGFEGPLVLRLAHDDHDAAREAIVQDGVARAGVPRAAGAAPRWSQRFRSAVH